MSRRIVVSVFSRAEDLLGAVKAARGSGLTIVDAYAPHAVHGLDRAMGLRPSRLPWICFGAAAIGAILKLAFEFWTTMVDWPVNVGGKPWNSLPAFVPVTFEVMVLSAGVTTVLAFFLVSRLWPGKPAILPAPGVTDDRFVLVLAETDAAFDLGRVRRLLAPFRSLSIDERLEEVGP